MRHVLVVDDETDLLEAICETLEAEGYSTSRASNGSEALDRLRTVPTCLVLLDLTMPVMNGEQAFERLRHIRPDVRVVLTSGYDEADATGRFRGASLAGFIQKPYTSAKLAQCIKRVFERANSADGG